MSMAIVDVNSSNVSSTWPLLLQAIKTADFIALDLELSGLGKVSAKQSMEDHYRELSAVVASRSILSLGVACCSWGCGLAESDTGAAGGDMSTATPLRMEVFNVWLLTQQSFVTDPSSARFLLQHGFDFNKQYAQGLPYTPPSLEAKTSATPPSSLEVLWACLLQQEVPLVLHNGWLDLLFLYYSFHGPLPPDSASFLADLTAMFPGGIYDTKALAQFQFREDATFLEYLFRICQYRNMQRGSRISIEVPPHLQATSHVEWVEITPPPVPSPDELTFIKVCNNFKANGYCHARKCSGSHDVLVAIAQSQQLKQRRAKKRKIGRAKRSAAAKQLPDSMPTADMAALFQEELAAARAKLGSGCSIENGHDQEVESGCGHKQEVKSESHTLRCEEMETEVQCSDQGVETRGCSQVKGVKGCGQERSKNPGFGHRAGFDAFMTAYAFACYAIESSPTTRPTTEGVESPEGTVPQHLVGVAGMRNALASRGANWTVPLRILKSHFTKTSATHNSAIIRLKKAIS